MSEPKIYNWNPEKSRLLARERGVSFERIVFEISMGNEVAVVMHPARVKGVVASFMQPEAGYRGFPDALQRPSRVPG